MRIRVIAVERIFPSASVVACVYKNNELLVYDANAELYKQKEFFSDFEQLSSLIAQDKYMWTDFYMNKGDKIYIDEDGLIMVDGEKLEPISRVAELGNDNSPILIKVYYEFLKLKYKGESQILKDLRQSYESGDLKKEILEIIKRNPLSELRDIDKKLIIMTRLMGMQYMINYVKVLLKSDEPYRFQEIEYTFSRLFKLVSDRYIRVD